MIDLKHLEAWFVTGSQHLYGQQTLDQVATHSREIAAALDRSSTVPVKIVFEPNQIDSQHLLAPGMSAVPEVKIK